MTAHPKYYSFVGLIAPEDRKAVYMGYAFLYGVFGALLGTNIGAFLWERLVAPVVGTPAVHGRVRWFWLLFAVLDVLAAGALIVFARKLGEDNARTRRQARVAMTVVYALVALLGGAFVYVAVAGPAVQYKTLVQAVIFLCLGGGGLVINGRRGRAAGTPRPRPE
jgi:MFS family permease